MARNRTEKSNFESQYGGEWITGAQRLAEIACERIAASQGQSLFPLFWKDKEWTKRFLQQIKHANDLLKSYSIDVIFEALRCPLGTKVYSLGAPFFKDLIELKNCDVSKDTKIYDLKASRTDTKPRNKKNHRSSLREKLEGL